MEQNNLTVSSAIAHSMGDLVENQSNINDATKVPIQSQRLTPQQLLKLGSVWYMPVEQVEHNEQNVDDKKPHSLIYKPERLTLANETMILQKGDYLRIHHTPRRFVNVYQHDWSAAGNQTNLKKKVVVHESRDGGFLIIDKPPLVPVHATVDNILENVVHQIDLHNPMLDYVTTTQRIDINTSGLLVVATKREFAAYFAQLLRQKTKATKKKDLTQSNDETSTIRSNQDNLNIQKGYKCLVCVQEDSTSSISTIQAWKNLKNMEDTVVRHYLESSIKAPKRFETEVPPEDIDYDESKQAHQPQKWLECLLKIRHVSPLIPVPTPDSPLAKALWSQSATSIPPNTKAVCEVDIQLLTGRTHQIRGQLSKLGYPIVGDEQYNGAIPNENASINDSNDAQLLALQCCHIGFWDADYEQVWNQKRRKEITQGFPSKDRWVSVSLEEAWWTSFLSLSTSLEEKEATTSFQDVEQLERQKSKVQRREDDVVRSDLLPPRVQLSPGKNKYVLIKVESNDDAFWFVKSASPKECGGPYHANVAEDLVEWIQAAGYCNIQVTGGGRIDYNSEKQHAHIYGYSYGYGKGNHEQVAELIASFSDNEIRATYDNSNSLY